MKENFTFEEQQLMSIYNPGTRLGLIHALVKCVPIWTRTSRS